MDGRSEILESLSDSSIELVTSFREKSFSTPQEMPSFTRLETIRKSIENVDQVLEDMKQLQMKGEVLKAISKTEQLEIDVKEQEQASTVQSNSGFDGLNYSKLDVGELVLMDRCLQHVKWMQAIQSIAEKVSFKMPKCQLIWKLLKIPRPLIQQLGLVCVYNCKAPYIFVLI